MPTHIVDTSVTVRSATPGIMLVRAPKHIALVIPVSVLFLPPPNKSLNNYEVDIHANYIRLQ